MSDFETDDRHYKTLGESVRVFLILLVTMLVFCWCYYALLFAPP